MISDIRRKIGRIAVLTDENVVLELKVVDVLLSFALGEELICEDFLVLVPDRAVLLVGQTLRGKLVDNSLYRAALVKLALEEPLVVGDFVSRHVLLHLFDVLGQGVIDESLFALVGGDVQQRVAVLAVLLVREIGDVASLIAVLGKDDLVALVDL